jgi:glutathione S-transferase
MDADRRKAAICEAAGIPLHRLNVNPLPKESELRALLQLAPLQRAPVFDLRDSARR